MRKIIGKYDMLLMIYVSISVFHVASASRQLSLYANLLSRFTREFSQCSTEPRKRLGTWLREISSCSCLTFLPGPAWVLLSKICKGFFSALYDHHIGLPLDYPMTMS